MENGSVDKVRLYHALPYPLKVAVASARGLQLRRWRYGPETERLAAEALDRERWNPSRLAAWQHEKLSWLLRHAAASVPFYRRHWEARRRAGDRSSLEILANWPVLEKEAVRSDPAAFLAEGRPAKKLFPIHTSGTTGKPLQLWQDRESLLHWYALSEARWHSWYGVSRDDAWAIFGGQLVTPVERRRPPFWVWNAPMRQLYASSYHLAPDLIRFYAQALREHRIAYLWGYSSALYTLAREIRDQNLDVPVLKVAIANAEPLYPYQKRTIEAALGCRARETYGMSEKCCGASECEHGSMHLWPEAGVTEVLDGAEPVPEGTSGDLVFTGLLNSAMPLIRYRAGDRGSLAGTGSPCACGRSLPALRSIEGRIDDLVYTADGREVGRLDPVFKGDLPVHEVQLIQESLESIRVRYVPAPGFSSASAHSIAERLQQRLGPVRVELEAVDRIPAGPNGKFRAVISNVRHRARSCAAPSPQ